MENGISFQADISLGMFSKSVPLKVVFSDFKPKKKIIVLEILLNSDSLLLKKSFTSILNAISRFIPEDSLPEGVEPDGNFIYVSPNKLLEDRDLPINITYFKMELGKAAVSFELKS